MYDSAVSIRDAGLAPFEKQRPVASETRRFQRIETVEASDLSYRDFLKRFVHANRPVVLNGVAQNWPAMSKWQPEYFRKRFGKQEVAVAYDKYMPFDQFIDEVLASSEQAPGPYMFRLFLHEHMPELLADVIPQNKFAYPRRYASPLMPERVRRPDGYLKLLIGGPGSKFPVMHFDGDNAHAAITEIHGLKEMILFAPEDSRFVYPKPGAGNVSLVDNPHSPDLARFPLMANAKPYQVVLEPGQMIFIPSRWWHTARPLTPSVSVCTNILDGSNWAGFVDDSANAKINDQWRRIAKRAYLGGLGKLLSLCETLQERSPRLAKGLIFPERLSPISADMAPEPSARQLKIRIPTP